jgi:hypothetical protein
MSDLKSKVFALLTEAGTDIQTLFFQYGISDEHERYDSVEATELKNQLDVAGIRFVEKDHYGGEDQGSDYWTVYEFSNKTETVFIKFTGWYASHVGSEFEEFYAVEGKTKTVVEYEKQ